MTVFLWSAHWIWSKCPYLYMLLTRHGRLQCCVIYIVHVYFHCVFPNQILKSIFSLRRKKLLEDIELCKVVYPVFCLLLQIGIIQKVYKTEFKKVRCSKYPHTRPKLSQYMWQQIFHNFTRWYWSSHVLMHNLWHEFLALGSEKVCRPCCRCLNG